MTAAGLLLHVLAAGVLFGVIMRLAHLPCACGALKLRVHWNLWVAGQVFKGVGALAMLLGHVPLAAGLLLTGIALSFVIPMRRRSDDQ